MTTSDERTFTQAQVNALVARERRETAARFADYEDLKAKAAQLDTLTQAAYPDDTDTGDEAHTTAGSDTAQEPDSDEHPAPRNAAPQLSDIQTENATLRTQLLRQEIAADKNLPAKLWKRVGGTTPQEIEADVDDLLSTASATPKPKAPVSSLKSGASVGEYRSPKERAAAALRGMSR